MDIENLAERIKQNRKSKGLTQAELAEQLGISEMTVRRWETGKRSPRLEEIEKVASVLGISQNALLNEEIPITFSGNVSEISIEHKMEKKEEPDTAKISLGDGKTITVPATPEGYAFLKDIFLASLNSTSQPAMA